MFGAKGVALRQYLVPFWWIGGVGGIGVLVHWCIGVSVELVCWCIGDMGDLQHARPLRGSADMKPMKRSENSFFPPQSLLALWVYVYIGTM